MNLNQLSKVQSAILITGATGTGKTSLAKKIHQASDRKHKNFVSVNLAGLSDELFLSELFGHKRGSFTGAHSDRAGQCDMVLDGTLFLDEIGDLTPMQQKYLLKLIDEKKYKSVGDNHYKCFTGTIIMATHKNLEAMVQKGQFRQDLFYRIRVFQKQLVPLVERPYELKKIIQDCQQEVCDKLKMEKKIHPELWEILLEYDWPGNIRELKNSLEFMVIASEGEMITKDALPGWIQIETDTTQQLDYQNCHQKWEKQYLIKKLLIHNGKINETAEKIGISKVTLISKIKRYTIDVEYIKILNQAYKHLQLQS